MNPIQQALQILNNSYSGIFGAKSPQVQSGFQSPIPQRNIVPGQTSPISSAIDTLQNNISSWPGLLNIPNILLQGQGNATDPSNLMANAMSRLNRPTDIWKFINPIPLPGQGKQAAAASPSPQVLAAATRVVSPAPTQGITPAMNATITPNPYSNYSPIPTPTSIPHIDDSFTNILNNHILPITRAAGIPDPVAAAQTGAESTHGRSGAAQKQNNYHGVMQWDKQGNRSLKTFSSPEESARAYIQTIQHILPNYQDFKNDPLGMLKALQDKNKSNHLTYEGDNKNPMQYVHDVTSTPEWSAYGGGQSYNIQN